MARWVIELKNKIKRVWWREFIQHRADMVGLDASIIMHPAVWKASGHVDHFTDPMVDCRECRHRFRADKVDETPSDSLLPGHQGQRSSASREARRAAIAGRTARCAPIAERAS